MNTVLVQIYRFQPEIEMLRAMSESFLENGLKMVLWTNTDKGNTGLDTIPFVWSDDNELFFNLTGADLSSDDTDKLKWIKYVEFIEHRYNSKFPAYDVECNFKIAKQIFDTLKPSLFLCWAGAEPCYAISKEIALSKGIPTLIWEAGMLPDTFLVDKTGICGQSEISNVTLPQIDDVLIKEATLFLENWRNHILEEVRDIEIYQSKTLKVLVLGGMDVANAVLYPGDKSTTTLVDYEDGIDVAIKVSEVNNGVTLFRPHPREPKEQLDRLKVANVDIDQNKSLYESILSSDVIVGYGSKADFVSLTLGKPFIMVGRGFISRKDCSYSSLKSMDLFETITNAVQNTDKKKYQDNYIKLIAWLLNDIHYNRYAEGFCKKGVKELVGDVIDYANFDIAGGEYYELLSNEGRKWHEKNVADYQFQRKCISNENPLVRLQNGLISLGDKAIVILDFDHTLWLGNSTEQFIANVKPRLWGEILDKVAIKIWNKYKIGYDLDHFRLLIISFLAPFSWFLWRRKVIKTIDTFWNDDLWTLVQKNKYKKLIIISYGFKDVIGPILKAKGLVESELNVISSEVFSSKNNVRRKGKVESIDSKFNNLIWDETITVSDSLEDYPLLNKSNIGILTKWNDPTFIRTPGYYPFRYLNRCKYINTTYFEKFILEQDFVVWLLILCSDLRDVFPAVLLFFSFQFIYEIGYYENDFIGAKREKEPILSAQTVKFRNYTITPYAWILSILFAIISIIALNGEIIWQKLILWIGALIIMRVVFHIYNKMIPEQRLKYYLVLQSLKNFSGILLFIPNITGLILAIAHMFQHTVIYYIYRTGGDKNKFPRASIRALVFFIALIILIIIRIKINLITLSIILVWLLQQELIERRGDKYMLFNLITQIFLFWNRWFLYFKRKIKKIMKLSLNYVTGK